MSDLSGLEQRRQELTQQIETLMKDIRPLKRELETVTDEIYRIHCQNARDLPVWELRVNPAKTLHEASRHKLIVQCSGVTWQEMYDTAVRHFAASGIVGWTMSENSGYRDSGQFCYEDGYPGGPILGQFEIIKSLPKIVRAFDFEAIP